MRLCYFCVACRFCDQFVSDDSVSICSSPFDSESGIRTQNKKKGLAWNTVISNNIPKSLPRSPLRPPFCALYGICDQSEHMCV